MMGLIARVEDLRPVVPAAGPVLALGQGFGLVALGEAVRDAIGEALADDPDLAHSLPRYMVVVLRSAGLDPDPAGPVACIDVWPGFEGAFVYHRGDILGAYHDGLDETRHGPMGEPVNAALRDLGVRRGEAADECAAIGLVLHSGRQQGQ
ncbi:MAG: hypothetical protein KJO75_03170 [Dactylosporangium sp.]|nr:hypothetical protein [Dactylosporangium sp.]